MAGTELMGVIVAKKKRKEIPQSHYYDGRRKSWKIGNFENPDDPTIENVEKWISAWEETSGYPEQESALKKLFVELCPNNVELDDILIKACTLNDFYSTNIFQVFKVAKVIKDLEIDERLNSDDLDTGIVDDLVKNTYEITGRSIYSFASKYCSHHKPEKYPIYDSYVDILLRYYRDNCENEEKTERFSFEDAELKNYSSFCRIENDFKKYFGLTKFNAKEIDKFLWQVGKKCFPKWESEEIDKNEEK